MSGGVDSSVAALLLKRADFNVAGVFMKFWSAPDKKTTTRWNRCCSSEAERRARRVAAILDIPFYVFNFEKEFKKRIVDYFLKEYGAGRTPNPCVVCNKEIKLGLFLGKALAMGADFVATGHYARIRKKFVNSQQIRYSLISSKDKNKDQSYFLWQLSQNQLRHILFPIGDYTKKEVRGLAKKFGLPVADTPESQEICFVKNTINEFLGSYIKQKPGKIVDKSGKIIGHHQGLVFYTIGQRKGIRLSSGPYWVLEKDIKKNYLIVTKNEKDLYTKELIVKNVNWISGEAPALLLGVRVKIRYRSSLAEAKITKFGKNKYKVIFNRPQRAVAGGQSAVFYSGRELLGGGVIT